MNKNNRNRDLHKDQRLSHLDPERLSRLLSYAKELSEAPQNQKMNTFLSIHQRASGQNISFSEEERDLLIQVLTEHMSPDEKKRVEMILTFASRFSPHGNTR